MQLHMKQKGYWKQNGEDLANHNRISCYFEKVLDGLALLAVLQYAIYRFLQSTMFLFTYTEVYKTITFFSVACIGSIRYVYILVRKISTIKAKDELVRTIQNNFLILCLTIPFIFVGLRQNYKFLVFLPFCALCLYKIKSETILRSFLFSIGTMLIATIICCLSGTVRNLVGFSESMPAAYGIINTSDFASYFTFLLLVIWCVLRNHKWCVSVLFCLFSIFVSIIVYKITRSQTTIICGGLIAFICLWNSFEENYLKKRNKCKNLSKTIKALSVLAFPIIGLLVVYFTASYGQQKNWAIELDHFFSGRLEYTWLPYQTYGIKPFGNRIETMHGYGGTLFKGSWTTLGYGYIDIAYAMLAIRYGWVVTLVFSGVWIWMTIRAFHAKQDRIAFSLVILAIHAFSETRILDINYNIFLAMPLCTMCPSNQSEGIREASQKKKYAIYAIIVAIVLSIIVYIFLPRELSCLRTFFSIHNWNKGNAAIGSLIVCAFIILIILGVWKTLSTLLVDRSKKSIFALIGLLFIIIYGKTNINNSIDHAIQSQILFLDNEKDTIKLIQQEAKQPVYVAESEEIYQRYYGGFANHVFSSEELCRDREGTIITNSDIELLRVPWTGGKYTEISEWHGVYSYDQAVISALTNKGYEWSSFYNGWRSCNLVDTAQFNGLSGGKYLVLNGPFRILTKDMETDQFGGKYELQMRLSSYFNASEREEPIIFEVLGEAGDSVIFQETIATNCFDKNGTYLMRIEYETKAVPKAIFSISVPEKVSVTIEDLSWRRIE